MKKSLLFLFATIFLPTIINAQPINNECSNAIPLTVNSDTNCTNITSGTITGATASNQPIGSCIGNANDDVWFVFTPLNNIQIITLSNIIGSTQNLNFALYSGSCGNLTSINCSVVNSLQMIYPTFIVGATYYLRVWSNATIAQDVSFHVCIKAPSTCENSDFYCGAVDNDPYIFPNTTGIINNTRVACLNTIPNPTFFTLKVTEPGILNFNIVQNSAFDVAGNPIGTQFDADFVAWGPFPDNQSCNQISLTDCICPNNTTNNSFYPFGNIVDCSYSGSAIENLTITNALAGQYYKILISNFSNQPGFIKMQQTNFADPNAGKTVCADRIQLSAFLDLNSNDVKDSNESNFNLGTFKYQVNNVGDFTYITSPFGKHSIYDSNPINSYDVAFDIFPEYANFYSLTNPTFNDLIIGLNSGNQIINFPVTILQNYTDLSINVIPVGAAIRGTTHANKIVYKNNGSTPASGLLSFTKSPLTGITGISQPGTVVTPLGFIYNYTNLLPNETRTINLSSSVPANTSFPIGALYSNEASITTTNSDITTTNNLSKNSQYIVGSNMPNVILESRGNQIVFNQFSQNDYLIYTIRFQNTSLIKARNLKIVDLLDPKIDELSIRVIDASHFYYLERNGSEINFRFDNIFLVPSSQNTDLSKGYVTFKVKLKPGLVSGTIIPNSAKMYFDSNPVVNSNTFNTQFTANLANVIFDASNFMIFPNPAYNLIQINLQKTDEVIESILINDILGKSILKISNISSKQQSLDISNLSKGVYFVAIITESKLKQTKKLIIQ